jgi:hypothetical protein
MTAQAITPGNSVSVSASFRYELQTYANGARAQLVLTGQGDRIVLAEAQDSQSRIGDAVPRGGAGTVSLSGTGSTARVFDGADRATFPRDAGMRG